MKFEFHFFQETYPWHIKAPTTIIKLPIIMKPQLNITAKPQLITKPATTRAQLITLTLPMAMRCTRRITLKKPASFMPTSTARRRTLWPTRAETVWARQRALPLRFDCNPF